MKQNETSKQEVKRGNTSFRVERWFGKKTIKQIVAEKVSLSKT